MAWTKEDQRRYNKAYRLNRLAEIQAYDRARNKTPERKEQHRQSRQKHKATARAFYGKYRRRPAYRSYSNKVHAQERASLADHYIRLLLRRKCPRIGEIPNWLIELQRVHLAVKRLLGRNSQ